MLAAAVPAVADVGDIPDGGAVFNYRCWHCQAGSKKFRIRVSQRVTILNERGQGYAELSFSEDRHKQLKSVSIRVLDQAGNLLYQRGKKDLTKACGFGGVALYDDACTYYGTFKAQRFPYSIEYEYEVESESLFYLRGCVFQFRVPVQQASYTLETADKVSFRHRTYGLAAGLQPTVSNMSRTYVWEIDSLPALDAVDYVPPGGQERARLALAPDHFRLEKYDFDGSSWSGIDESYARLYQDRYLPAAASVASDLPAQASARARLCYDKVRQEIRYVAIEVGLGGWRPYSASLTQERGFGDCKDMSTLLISYLRNAGIESYPVHVLTRNDGPIDPGFPSFHFNHVIVLALVDRDTVWLDPVCDKCPYGQLPLMDEDIDVLVGGPDGGRLRRTPASTAEENSRVRTTHFHVDAERRIRFESRLQAIGNYAQFLRRNLPDLDADETRRFVDRRFPGAGKKFRIDSYEIENLDDLDQPVVISVKAAMTKAARVIRGTLYCPPFVLNKLGDYELADLTDREYALTLYYPESEIDHITVTWDSALSVGSIGVPDGDSLAFPFGEIVLRSSVAADTVRISLDRKYLAYQVTPDQFDDFAVLRKRTKWLFNQQVKLIAAP